MKLRVATAALVLALPVAAHAADTIPAAVMAAVSAPGRPPDDVVRDSLRKPGDVVAFSRIKPGDHIAELSPAGGYYTRILSKLVGPKGKLYTIVPHAGWRPLQSPEQKKALAEELGIRGDPRAPVTAALAIADITDYANVTVLWEALDQFGAQFAVPEQLDAVWTTNNYHDYHNKSSGPLDMAAVDKSIFAALKPGGYYFVADHAAATNAGFSVTASLHRAEKSAVIKEVQAAGFVLDGESNTLANAADDHTKPIFDASMRGHTDQFVLRFKKPANAANTDKRPAANAMDGYFGNTNISAKGDRTERHVFYHPDHTYQEYGMPDVTPVQQGLWFWDAAGHNCMISEFPVDGRNTVVCHAAEPFKKPGQEWPQDTYGTGLIRTHMLVPGHVLTPAATSAAKQD